MMKPVTPTHDDEQAMSKSNLTSSSDLHADTGVSANRESPPRMPRWVKVFVIIGLVLVVLLVIGLLTGAHGPGRHMPSSSVTQQHVYQP